MIMLTLRSDFYHLPCLNIVNPHRNWTN